MDFDRQLQIYAELAVKVALNLQPGQRLMIIGPLANGGASLEAAPLARQIAAAAYRAGSPLVETIVRRRGAAVAALQACAARFVRQLFGVASERALRARGRGACGAVDQRERSRSASGRAAGSRQRRAAGDRARDAAVPRADVAQRHQLGDRCGRERGLGRKNLSRRADERGGLAVVGCDRAHVPPRRARSARGVGNAPGKPRGAQRVPEHQAVLGAEVHRDRAPI